MEFKTTRDFYKSNQILTRLKKLIKENMKLKEMIKNGNPVKCCRCIEVDVWKKKMLLSIRYSPEPKRNY